MSTSRHVTFCYNMSSLQPTTSLQAQAYKKMNALEARSHSIQTKQRAKSRDGDRPGTTLGKTSPGGRDAGQAKEKDSLGPARDEARDHRASVSVEVAEAEDAVKKIYLITGAPECFCFRCAVFFCAASTR